MLRLPQLIGGIKFHLLVNYILVKCKIQKYSTRYACELTWEGLLQGFLFLCLLRYNLYLMDIYLVCMNCTHLWITMIILEICDFMNANYELCNYFIHYLQLNNYLCLQNVQRWVLRTNHKLDYG